MPTIIRIDWYLNDWLADTCDLDPIEYWIYHRLLMQYYKQAGAPLVRSYIDRITNVLRDEEKKKVEYILRTYFSETADGFSHHRADQEIAKLLEKSEKARKSVMTRYSKPTNEERQKNERSTDVDRTNIERSTDEVLVSSQESIVNKPPKGGDIAREPRAPRRKPAAALNFYGLPDALVADWIRSRGSKKLTQTAIDGFKREADAAGWTLERAVRFSIENGYQGFRHNWESVRNVGSTSSVTKAELDRSAAWSAYIKPYVAKCMRPPLTYEQWTEQYEREHGSGMSAEEEYELQGGRS
ncbi:MAG: DUF1376 domain-containing protein [Duodenibacillus sp.]|nr:DUF1376 domain-containing protein [Duodenibacillus sp.]